MIDQYYDRMTSADRENFQRIVNQLLAHTFLFVNEYNFNENISVVNRDYLFAERNFELLTSYFELAGFRLERDSSYGVISLVSSYDANRVRFDKLTTLAVYTLRLIYEEEREKLTLTSEVIITVADLVNKMITLGIVRRKPANKELHDLLRTLVHFRILVKAEGVYEAPETRYLILPTILFIVNNEQISNMYRLLEEKPQEESDETAEEEPDEETE